MLLDAVESFFKLGDEGSFARGKTVTTHDAPEIRAPRPVPVVDGQDIFRRSACDQNDDVGLGGLVDQCQLAPLLNGVLHGTDRLAIFGKQIRVELISVIGGHVDIVAFARVPGNAGAVAILGLGAATAEIAVIAIRMAATKENRFI